MVKMGGREGGREGKGEGDKEYKQTRPHDERFITPYSINGFVP
jgi:hypothetical protein